MKRLNLKFIGIYIIIFSVSILSFLLLEAINALEHEEMMERYIEEPYILPINAYDLSNIKFKRVYLTDKYKIGKKCEEGCNLSITANKRTIYFMISKESDGYYYDVAINSRLLLEKKYLGNSIEKAYFDNYNKNIVFYNNIGEDELAYDYIHIIDKNYSHEEIRSVGSETIKLTEEGIIYNEYRCRINPDERDMLLIKKRCPFSKEEETIEEIETYFSWCA